MGAPGPLRRGSGAPATGAADADADAIVVGAGPNGLVAANLLADAGWSVLVLEANDEPGGSVRSAELIEPGFLNDACSAFYPLATGGSPIDDLRLDQHGLRWLHAPTVLAHPVADGSCPIISRDLATTAGSLDALHPGDGAAWEDLMRRWTDLQPHLSRLIYRPFPPVAAAGGLLRTLPPRDLARFGRFLMLPARRMGEEEFGGHGDGRGHVAVVAFERVAPAAIANGAALHALGAALVHDAAAEGRHHQGIEMAGARDEQRVGRGSIEDATGRSGQGVRQVGAGRHAREATGEGR